MSAQPDTNGQQPPESRPLVVRQLSVIQPGENRTPLEIINQFALEAPVFMAGRENVIADAEKWEVTDHISCQMADEKQDSLKRENKEWDERRLSVTRPLDDLKKFISSMIAQGLKDGEIAIRVYQEKISVYRAKERQRVALAQRNAEHALGSERDDLLRRAEDLEKKATAKRGAVRREMLTEAADLRAQAELMPDSVALAVSGPTLAASTAGEQWEGFVPLCDKCKAADAKRPDPKRECPHNRKKAVEMILANWEMWGSVIQFRQGSSRSGHKGLNDMAAHYKDTTELPGFEFKPRDVYRSRAVR